MRSAPRAIEDEHLALRRGQLLQLQQLEVAHDVGERGVELVGDAGGHLADGGQLLGLQQLLLGLLQLLDRALLALEQLRVLDGEGGVAGERLGGAQGVGAEGLGRAGVVDVEDAERAREAAAAVGAGAGRAQREADDGLAASGAPSGRPAAGVGGGRRPRVETTSPGLQGPADDRAGDAVAVGQGRPRRRRPRATRRRRPATAG